MTTLHEAFARARSEGRAALIGYLPAGFPTRDDSIRLMRAMVDSGVDIVEVGLPYSDPLMDGPVIQAAADQALRAGMTPAGVLDVAGEVASSGAATVVMSYWNPIERFGVDHFAALPAQAGGSGVITPDPTPDIHPTRVRTGGVTPDRPLRTFRISVGKGEAETQLIFRGPTSTTRLQLRIRDAAGALVATTNRRSPILTVADLPAGTYTWEVYGKTRASFTLKVTAAAP